MSSEQVGERQTFTAGQVGEAVLGGMMEIVNDDELLAAEIADRLVRRLMLMNDPDRAELPTYDDTRTFEERLRNTEHPFQVANLIGEAFRRLRASIPDDLHTHGSRLVHAYLVVEDESHASPDELFISYTDSWGDDPVAEIEYHGKRARSGNSRARIENNLHNALVATVHRPDNVGTGVRVMSPLLLQTEGLYYESPSANPRTIWETSNQRVFRPGDAVGQDFVKIFGLLDRALDYYENKLQIGPAGTNLTFADVRRCGYVDKITGRLQPDYLDSMRMYHSDMMAVKE